MTREQRERGRQATRNFLDYIVLAEDGTPIARGLGRTLDVSGSGLLMETAERVDAGQALLVTLGLGEEMVEFPARVMRSSPSGEDLFATGVAFAPVEGERRAVLDRYLSAFQTGRSEQ